MAFIMCLFVIAYVWQNIEVMKIKMEFRTLAAIERELIMTRDLYLIHREAGFRADLIARDLPGSGIRRITPDDVEIIDIGK